MRTEYAAKGMTAEGLSAQKLAGDTANWNRGQAMSKMSLWLDTYGEQIEAVISNNDDMALGAIDAIERAGASGIQVVGIDGTTPGLKAVEDGKMMGTVSSDKEAYAAAVFGIAMDQALGNNVEEDFELTDSKYYLSPQHIVTKN